jgi:ADP-ribosylglycohydrolase
MENIIKEFEETKMIIDVHIRTSTRDKLISNMYELVCKTKNIKIDFIDIKTKKWGEVAVFLVCVLAKLRNFDCYDGKILTPERFNMIIEFTGHESKYLRHMVRILISNLINAGVFTIEEKKNLQKFLIKYNFDDKSGYNWVWDCLVLISIIDEDSFVSSLISQAVGDSLGFIVEGHNSEVCGRFVNEFVIPEKIPTQVRIPGLTFGQYSDDTQLARETYVSMIQSGGKMDPALYGMRIGCLFQPGHYRIVGYGITTAKAGEALYHGKHYSQTGSKTTVGNGSAMRSCPLGLILSQKSDEELKETVTIFSSITHASRQCIDSCILIAFATKAAMFTKNIKFNVDKFLNYIASKINDTEYANQILNIQNLLNAKDDDAAKNHFVSYGIYRNEEQWGDGLSSGVCQSTLWSLYCFCKHPDNFVDCCGLVISGGGDSDTTSAISCAVWGARNQYEKIPSIWKNELHDLNDWKLDELITLVKDVYKMII